ncbi:hypothetical protein N9W60_03780 [Flavobacteriaceae bacterium]|nr:hypothetical protein [Flavobacteriaceae bacterium]
MKVIINITPAGGTWFKSIYCPTNSPTRVENNKAPTSPSTNAIKEAASTIKPLENPFTAPNSTRPTMAMSM